MLGTATLATDVSRTSKTVASITDAAISHGFTLGFQTVVSAVNGVICDINGSLDHGDKTSEVW
jgi:hypothetical protein